MKYVLFIWICLFTLGCKKVKQLDNEQYEYSFMNSKYIDNKYQEGIKNLSPKILFTHFPESLYNYFNLQVSTNETKTSYNYILFVYDCKKEVLTELMQRLEKTALERHRVTDSSLNVIKENINSYRIARERIINGQTFIPFFEPEQDVFNENLISTQTSCGLNLNFDIYIIDCKSNYKQESSDIKYIFDQLPRTHNEAFSRGICINEKDKCVIYWTIFI